MLKPFLSNVIFLVSLSKIVHFRAFRYDWYMSTKGVGGGQSLADMFAKKSSFFYALPYYYVFFNRVRSQNNETTKQNYHQEYFCFIPS